MPQELEYEHVETIDEIKFSDQPHPQIVAYNLSVKLQMVDGSTRRMRWVVVHYVNAHSPGYDVRRRTWDTRLEPALEQHILDIAWARFIDQGLVFGAMGLKAPIADPFVQQLVQLPVPQADAGQ